MRGDVSSRLGAALINALLYDLEPLLKENINIKDILMDKCKIDRAKNKVRLLSKDEQSKDKSKLNCIGIDGRIDQETKTFKEIKNPDGSICLKPCIIAEHHLTFTSECGSKSGEYLTHETIPNIGATGLVMAQAAHKVLAEYESVDSIKALLLDNTAANVGHLNGLVVSLENIIGRPLQLIGCSLHQNELPWKAVFRKIDGATTGPRTFDGKIGILCQEDMEDKPQIKFKPIGSSLVELPSEILNDLSHDQRLLYEYTSGIQNGSVNSVYASRKVGPVNHAR